MKPLVDLSIPWLIVTNVILWGFLQFGLAKIMTSFPPRWFHPGRLPYRLGVWEGHGRFWDKWFRVQGWKKRLPSGARMTGGFSLERMFTRDPDRMERIRIETCRAEATHLLALGLISVFFLFNPIWAMPVHVFYGLLSNFPCLIAQRYNRGKLERLLQLRNQTSRPKKS